jgi:type I restriction-modification system DNA methylase subunit
MERCTWRHFFLPFCGKREITCGNNLHSETKPMSETRKAAKLRIEKLVHFFEQNIHQFKVPSFNETQARQQLIDPFFEALGWDITNRAMKPLYLQEVIPEGRVKTSFGKEVREQTVMFDAKESLGRKYKEYASILDYIAEDEYKASAREASKKPDYRFRIKGQTKFFVEAKKPFVDLSRNQDAIFQVKRYGFSGRVPVSILTDFEEFRVFDCTHKPLYEKPTLGVIKELDLTYGQYREEFDHLYDTFSREAVDAGSLDTLTKKLLQKKTGDFALDKTFLDDLSKWREELARDIAKHPRNRRTLNDYTLNESVQRILDRIVFFRVCEDREIEVENTLLAVLQMWKSRPGVSLYSLLNQLFQQRRTLYNGLLFSPHECEELEVGDDVLLKILQNLNYPFSPYHFNEIGVEILGSIYEKFLGKTIHLAKKNVIISEKPEVRKAGGVYYTPQYIVNYIVDNTLGKLLHAVPIPSVPTSSKPLPLKGGDREGVKLLLSPKQAAKLKIIDIACGSGSFLLGAFQKLIDHHIEWYHQHPKDIQTVNNVPDAYTDVNGNLRLSSRKKRDILVNNIYGVDIDRQAVEVTQMSLYLKVLENENADTLNPQMTLALKEVYLPSLADNIKCGNSLIGTDFGAQGEMFDDSARMKINPFDWEIEFAQIMKNGGFDCVIGNPPYGMVSDENLKSYYGTMFKRTEGRFDTFELFIEKGIDLCRISGSLGYIVPSPLLSNLYSRRLRRYLLDNHSLRQIVNFGMEVFEDPTIHTCIVIVDSGKTPRNTVEVRKRVMRVEELTGPVDYTIDQDRIGRNENSTIDIFIGPRATSFIEKMSSNAKPLGEICFIRQCIKTGDDSSYVKLSNTPLKNPWKPSLRGRSINRYMTAERDLYVKYGDWLARNWKNRSFYDTAKIVVRETGDRIMATEDLENRYLLSTLYSIYPRSPNESHSLRYILAILNSPLATYFVKKIAFELTEGAFTKVRTNQLARFPFRTIDFANPSEKKMHDDLVAFVDTMLDLHKQLVKSNFDSEKEPVERQIKATDNKIDELVYQLYGLTEEEIKVVEGRRANPPGPLFKGEWNCSRIIFKWE